MRQQLTMRQQRPPLPAAGVVASAARPLGRALALIVAAALVQGALADEPRTGKRGDELEERVPAVSGHLMLKGWRHELSPGVGLTLIDAFRQKVFAGGSYSFHFGEHWALTLHGASNVFQYDSGVVQVCGGPGTCRPPSDEELNGLPGNISLLAGASVEWAPIYGKLNLIAEKVFRFDVFATVGGGVAQYQFIRPDGTDESGMSGALTLGVGQRFFLTPWLALKLQVTDTLYFQPTGKTNPGEGQLSHQILFNMGFSFWVPFGFERGGDL